MKAIFPVLCAVALLFSRTEAATVVLVAGGGTASEGKATGVKLSAPFGTAFDPAGNMYLVEMTGNFVRKVDSHGMLSTVGGNGAKSEFGDGGPVAKATFNGIHNLAIAPNGDVYLADT